MVRSLARRCVGRSAQLIVLIGLAACGDDDAKPDSSVDGPDADTADAGREEEDAGQDSPELDAGHTSEDGGHDAGLGDAVTLRFKGKVGAHDYACDRSYPAQGSSGTRVTGRAFRFFASDFRLIDANGSEVPLVLDERPGQNPDLVLLDFQNPDDTCRTGSATNTTVTGHLPPGDYRGLKFSVGVPETLNHGDPALLPPPLRGSGMSWNWLQGYRFLVAELAAEVMDAGATADAAVLSGDGAIDAALTDGGVAEAGSSSGGGGHMGGGGGSGAHASEPGVGLMHIGSTGCIGSPDTGISCSKQNRASITLSGFDPSSDSVIADIGAIFSAVDLARGLQCHGRGDECATMFKALGVDLVSGEPAAAQTVFRVE